MKLTEEQLKQHGYRLIGTFTRSNGHSYTEYATHCVRCGTEVITKVVRLDKACLCEACRKYGNAIKAKQKAIEDEKKLLAELNFLSELDGSMTDLTHINRFNKALKKLPKSKNFDKSIEVAKRWINDYDSIPEVLAAIELLHNGFKIIFHQKVGGLELDFTIPEYKLVIEVDGSLYHNEIDKENRDYGIHVMLGNDWTVKHIPAESISSKPDVFGRAIRQWANRQKK